ncbi:E3 ubiquitin-protein ligase RNF220-like [Hemiscyllium ocellatum]|uniref:E3 ubiquitin-protein ligase RNF220-like n=1 Tax=Hemiscyllium ocellatum TaxID=170820 RepID=UPI0029660E92|nr:E3 ubiquitin-protein ligase RNF220-like [Hemiscyllium ocellatum]
MENSPGLLNSLTPPTLMVLASTTESTSGTTTLCQQPRTFTVPVTMEKAQVPFLGPTYTLAPMYHQAERSNVEYPVPLLHLHPQFGMLGYGTIQSFPPFQEMERYGPAYLTSKRLKQPPSVEPPQIRYLASDRDFKKYRADLSSGSLATTKRDPARGPGSTSSSHVLWKNPQPGSNKNAKTTHDCSTFLRCPLCQEELKRGDLQQHLQHELERLTAVNPSCEEDHPKESTSLLLMQSPPIKEEMESPSGSPVSTDQSHHLERQQTFQQVKINRESRLNARVKRCKRIRPSDEDQIDGPYSKEPRFLDTEEESPSGTHYVEYAWHSLGRNSTPHILGLRGSSSYTTQSLTSRDSDGDLDTDGDEPPIFTKFKCSAADGPNGQAQKLMEAEDRCLDSVVMRMVNPEDDGDMTSEILKARISELTHKLLQRETYRCHVCTGSYSVPLASIQCWHIHCEACWLRTLGSRKLCPQCNTITSPSDLRRIYL